MAFSRIIAVVSVMLAFAAPQLTSGNNQDTLGEAICATASARNVRQRQLQSVREAEAEGLNLNFETEENARI